jgi:hypothetical protein
MVTRAKAFPDRFLRGSDLPGPKTVTVIEAVQQKLKDFKSGEMVDKTVLYFDNCSPLPLTYDNFCAVCDISGQEDSDDWHGITLELYPVTVLIGGKEVVTVKVRKAEAAPPKPKTKKPTAESKPPYDDSIPF